GRTPSLDSFCCRPGTSLPRDLSTRIAGRRPMPEQNEKSGQNVGKLLEIRGVVIDAVFPDHLPEIYSALRVMFPGKDGATDIDLIAEVQQHLGDDRVRAVAMDSTDGLPRGIDVIDTGGPITVPVGQQTLGRVWNVIGEPVDQEPAPEGGG